MIGSGGTHPKLLSENEATEFVMQTRSAVQVKARVMGVAAIVT